MCFTAQSGSGIPRSPYQDEIELRGQWYYVKKKYKLNREKSHFLR